MKNEKLYMENAHFFPIQYKCSAVLMKICPSEIAGELRQ